MQALREGIEYHDHLYCVKNKPEISDAVYDKLFRRLQELEQAFPDLAAENSPTRRVGAAPLEELKRVEHAAPMLSLNAVFQEDEVQSFCETIQTRADEKEAQFVAEPKFDGVSVEVVYERGELTRGVTWGDGQTGEDISANLRTIRSLPLRLRGRRNIPAMLAVRGEAILPKDAFQKLNRERVEQGREPFANPRNAAAGTLRRLDPNEVAKRPLEVVFYDVLSIDGNSFDTHWDELKQLDRWGLKTDRHRRRCTSAGEMHDFHKRLADGRDKLPYEIDGVVIKADDRDLWERLGSRDRSPGADEDRLRQIPEIGPEIAHSVDGFLRESHASEALERFQQAGVEVQRMPTAGDQQPLAGQTFVFSGNLERFTRDEAKEQVEMLGGRATSSVSSQTDYLVVGDSPGSKLDEARKEDVEILNEQQFEELIAT